MQTSNKVTIAKADSESCIGSRRSLVHVAYTSVCLCRSPVINLNANCFWFLFRRNWRPSSSLCNLEGSVTEYRKCIAKQQTRHSSLCGSAMHKDISLRVANLAHLLDLSHVSICQRAFGKGSWLDRPSVYHIRASQSDFLLLISGARYSVRRPTGVKAKISHTWPHRCAPRCATVFN